MFGFFESEQSKKVRSHIHNLASLARVDGHIDEREMNFLVSVGKKNGLSSSDVRSVVAQAQQHSLTLPDNDSERFDQIFDLVDMMLADGVVDDNEMDFCIDMAEKLGFRKAIVGVLVRKISMGVRDGLPREQIKNESESFLNFKGEGTAAHGRGL
ncbi:tellurite resistance TerB family protein [Hymenobacter latericus]|uniref:tellurite resistance TerB family protein n=1 Tax=Hymenobacter sp. YIM 151858-1 TaxID=2987688 RepID=UPI002227715B|nr:TerB family tellurite resistance protein [Hymenobacter sp. YIM 151858-1]UYZ59783.1 TerB family tellurite resistance protein [Hymenobacter sp. YIM 151858-1]